MKRPRLTMREINALNSAASAMLAGEEGEGDAQGVSFDDLHSAHDKLIDMREQRRATAARRKRQS